MGFIWGLFFKSQTRCEYLVYDSNIFVDWVKYLLARLNYYISFCDIDIAGNSDLSHILYVMATEMFNAVQNEQNIPYVGVRRTDDRFEMCECPIKCESCPQYTGAYK